ncbi:MAG TPA: aldehyde dehydrogenase family protein [Flavobacteriales bacterium]|nr:aldehyde dehydrogenase family protein [Flavobacteriales bacterium]
MERIEILKTYKIYVGGKFPRTESGRTFLFNDSNGKAVANVCQCSRKDFRDAVLAARGAFGGWSTRAAFNRSQILYRIGEMLEGRKAQFVEELTYGGLTHAEAKKEVELAIDRTVYYAGWCDKYQQVFGTVNPVASSHFNFSVPEPMGVVVIVCGNSTGLLGLISMVMPAIAGGNSVIVLAAETNPLPAVTLGEVLATSDLPGGVINILTGYKKELLEHFATHLDVNAIVCEDFSNEDIKFTEEKATANLKRVFHYKNDWFSLESQGPYFIQDLQETKTTWHPIENIGGSGSGY